MKSVTKQLSMFAFAVTTAVVLALPSHDVRASELAWGAEPMGFDPRFEPLAYNERVVLDRQTQLIWLGEPAPKIYSWSQARDYCLNKRVFASKVDMVAYGWRLPSVHELNSVFHYAFDGEGYAVVLPFGRSLAELPFRELRELWTATSMAPDNFHTNPIFGGLFGPSNESYAYSVRIDDDVQSRAQPRRKDEPLGVVCVRGPANSDQY